MRLRQRVAEIDDVEMPDIGAEDRVELSAERVTLAKGGRVHAVVRLAAEIERVRVEIEPVLFPRDLARREIVELGAVAGQILRVGARPAVARLERLGDIVVPVFLDHAHQQFAVELFRLHAFERRRAAPLPMFDQIAEQLGGPTDASFEKREAQLREAPGDAAEKDRL